MRLFTFFNGLIEDYKMMQVLKQLAAETVEHLE